MRGKHLCLTMAFLVALAALSGCPGKDQAVKEAPRTPPPTALDAPAPATQPQDPPSLPEPIEAPYGPVEKLGKIFCDDLRSGDYAALAAMFHSGFLIRVNPKLQNLDEQDALRDMQGLTPKAIEDSLREVHTLRVTDCVVETTELRNCEDTALLASDAASGDVTRDSFLDAAAAIGVSECGIMQVRETSNAGILYSQIIVGNVDGEWKLLLGMD